MGAEWQVKWREGLCAEYEAPNVIFESGRTVISKATTGNRGLRNRSPRRGEVAAMNAHSHWKSASVALVVHSTDYRAKSVKRITATVGRIRRENH